MPQSSVPQLGVSGAGFRMFLPCWGLLRIGRAKHPHPLGSNHIQGDSRVMAFSFSAATTRGDAGSRLIVNTDTAARYLGLFSNVSTSFRYGKAAICVEGFLKQTAAVVYVQLCKEPQSQPKATVKTFLSPDPDNHVLGLRWCQNLNSRPLMKRFASFFKLHISLL